MIHISPDLYSERQYLIVKEFNGGLTESEKIRLEEIEKELEKYEMELMKKDFKRLRKYIKRQKRIIKMLERINTDATK